MARRTMFLMGVATVLTLTAGGVWAGLGLANAHTTTKAGDCSPDRPEGCSPESISPITDSTNTAANTSRCCDDPACFPGCCLECPPDCQAVTAEAKNAGAVKQTTKAKTCCPPCPFCP
jgi:hypothetical protein